MGVVQVATGRAASTRRTEAHQTDVTTVAQMDALILDCVICPNGSMSARAGFCDSGTCESAKIFARRSKKACPSHTGEFHILHLCASRQLSMASPSESVRKSLRGRRRDHAPWLRQECPNQPGTGCVSHRHGAHLVLHLAPRCLLRTQAYAAPHWKCAQVQRPCRAASAASTSVARMSALLSPLAARSRPCQTEPRPAQPRAGSGCRLAPDAP
eukprot:6200170-Pleurochrysis_carterae.AAC.4